MATNLANILTKIDLMLVLKSAFALRSTALVEQCSHTLSHYELFSTLAMR